MSKIKSKKGYLKGDWQISTYVLDKIVNKWDRDEAIMNLRDRIKQLELECGILKSEKIELENNFDSKIAEIEKKHQTSEKYLGHKAYKFYLKNRNAINEYIRIEKLSEKL